MCKPLLQEVTMSTYLEHIVSRGLAFVASASLASIWPHETLSRARSFLRPNTSKRPATQAKAIIMIC